MTTIDHFVPAASAHSARDHSATPSIIVAVLLVALMGVPALLAPANPQPTLDWHGNTATSAH